MTASLVTIARLVGADAETNAAAETLGCRLVDCRIVQEGATEAHLSPETIAAAARRPSCCARIVEVPARSPGASAFQWASPTVSAPRPSSIQPTTDDSPTTSSKVSQNTVS